MSEKITKEFILVIEQFNKKTNENINLDKLILNLKLITEFYAVILHDKDTKIDEETAEIITKRPHYHLIVKLDKRMRKMTLINHIAKFNNLQVEMIQADYLDNLKLSVRYLTHADNPEKHQYAPFEIISNQWHEIQDILNANTETNQLTAKQIIFYIYKMKYSITKIMEIIGLKTFNKYAKTISLIYDDYYTNPSRYEFDNTKKEEYQ